MADMTRSSRRAALPRMAEPALKGALKRMLSELLQSSSAGTWARRCPGLGRDRQFNQDPISRLNPAMLSRLIQYLVPESRWRGQRTDVELDIEQAINKGDRP